MVCAFSGHRPQRLPWGADESDPRCVALKLRMAQELLRLNDRGVKIFLCGMARGCDTYFAEAVLQLREKRPETQLWAVLPCAVQTDRWPAADRQRYARICRACQRVILLQEPYTKDCMLRRNQWMTEHADCVMTVYDGGRGGTAWMVREARRKGIPLISLWL